MIEIDISITNPELLALHDGDPSGVDLWDYIMRKFEDEVPNECVELKINTGLRMYDEGRRRNLTFLNIKLEEILTPRLTRLNTIEFEGNNFNFIQNFEHLGTIPTLREVRFLFFVKSDTIYNYSFITTFTQIKKITLNLKSARIDHIPIYLENLKQLEEITLKGELEINDTQANFFNDFINLKHLDITPKKVKNLNSLLSDLRSLESLNLSNSKIRGANLDFTHLTNLKSLDISHISGINSLLLPPGIVSIKASKSSHVLKLLTNDTEYSELKYLDVSETKHNLLFRLDTTEDHSLYNNALFKVLLVNNRNPERKYYLYVNLNAPKLTNLIINKIVIPYDLPADVLSSIDGGIGDYMLGYILEISRYSDLEELVANSLGKDFKFELRSGHNDKLTSLVFYNNQLSDFSILDNFPNLRKLDVRYCSEGSVLRNVESLNRLVNLRELHISQNDINNAIKFNVFPHLRVLDIGFSKNENLEHIFEGGTFSNLVKLNIFGNDLENLPEFIVGSFENLEILNANINNIREVPTSIGNLNKLRHFNMESNQISTLPPSIFDINFKCLKIGKNPITRRPQVDAIIECLNESSFTSAKHIISSGCFARPVPSGYGLLPLDALKDCMNPDVHLEICDDDYIQRLIDGNINEFIGSRRYGTVIDGKLMEYKNDEELDNNFVHFFISLGADGSDINSLCTFNFEVQSGRAIDMGGPLKNFYDSLINKQLGRNTIFVKDGDKIGVNEDLHDILPISTDRTIGHLSLYSMIGGYTIGVNDFNSNFTFSHAMHLVYRFRQDYLSSLNSVKVGRKKKHESYAIVLKRFAIHFLNEDLEMIKELSPESNRMHVYAFLFAEFMDSDMIIEDTTYCKNVKTHNETAGSERKMEYNHVFKGVAEEGGEEEDLSEDAVDFLLDYEVDGEPLLDAGEEYQEGFDDFITSVNQRLEGRWWEDEAKLDTFRGLFRREWRHSTSPEGGAQGGEAPADNVPDNTNADTSTQPQAETEVLEPPEVMANSTASPTTNSGRENVVLDGSIHQRQDEPNLNPDLFPFVNDFILSILTQNNFTEKLTNIFADIIPISTNVGGNHLRDIANKPIKMFLILCPKFHPPLDKIANEIVASARHLLTPVSDQEKESLKLLFSQFLTVEDFILGDHEIVSDLNSFYEGSVDDFSSLFTTHEDILKPVFRYITGSRKPQTGLKLNIYNGESFAAHTCFNTLDVPLRFIKDNGGINGNPNIKKEFFTNLLKVSIFDTGYGVAGLKIVKKRNIRTKKQSKGKEGKGKGKLKKSPIKNPIKRKTKGISGRNNHTENTFVKVTPKRKRRLPRKP